MHLNQSALWKQASIIPSGENNRLTEVQHQGKDYLGCYIDSDTTSLAELASLENSIAQHLHYFCPDYDIGSIKPSIFTQVFIA